MICGASSGIGKELALHYAELGFKVGITGRRKALLEDIANRYPGSICYRQCDNLSDHVLKDLDSLLEELGGLDIFIHSAGMGELNPSLDYEIEDRTMSLNVRAFTKIVGWAYQQLSESAGGNLVGISSIGGLRGSYIAPAYNATKAFQISYLEGLRIKAAKSGKPIRITDVRPGLVDTEMAKGEGLFWVAPASKIAVQIARDIERNVSVSYVSRRWRAIAYLLKIMPRLLYAKL